MKDEYVGFRWLVELERGRVMGRSGGRGCREGSLRKGGRVGRSEKGWGGGIGIKDVELF